MANPTDTHNDKNESFSEKRKSKASAQKTKVSRAHIDGMSDESYQDIMDASKLSKDAQANLASPNLIKIDEDFQAKRIGEPLKRQVKPVPDDKTNNEVEIIIEPVATKQTITRRYRPASVSAPSEQPAQTIDVIPTESKHPKST